MTRKSLQVYRIIVYFFQRPIFGGDNSCTSWIFCVAAASGSRPFSTVRPHQRRGLPGVCTSPGECGQDGPGQDAGGFPLTVLPATSRVDLARLGHALGLDPGEVQLATADEIERIFHDCEPGTIPPFGRLYGLRTVADVSLPGAGVLVFRTNTRHLGMRMQFRDYEGLEEPFRADFGPTDQLGTGQSSPGTRQTCRGDSGEVNESFAAFMFHRRTVDSASLSSSGAKPRRIVFSVMLRVRRNSRR